MDNSNTITDGSSESILPVEFAFTTVREGTDFTTLCDVEEEAKNNEEELQFLAPSLVSDQRTRNVERNESSSDDLPQLKEKSVEELVQVHIRKAIEYLCKTCFHSARTVDISGHLDFQLDTNQIASAKINEIVKKNNQEEDGNQLFLDERHVANNLSKTVVHFGSKALLTNTESVSTSEDFHNLTSDSMPCENFVPAVLPKAKRKKLNRKPTVPERLQKQERTSLRCNLCDYKVRFLRHLKKHYKTKHQYQRQDLAKLDAEGLSSSNTESVDSHLVSEKRGVENFEKNDEAGRTHDFHGDVANEPEGCAKDFETKDEFNAQEEEYSMCLELPTSTETFQKHVKREHKVKVLRGAFSCRLCKSSFNAAEELQKHANDRHNHVCNFCDEVFTIKRKLSKHRMEKHKNEVLKCQTCEKMLPSTAALRKHTIKHDLDGNSFACDICGKTFTAASTLYHHKRGVHTTDKPYKCNLCDQGFSFHHSMKLHMLRHQGLRPHKCSQCDKSYLTATHLKGHMEAVHSTWKKFNCPICNKKFPYENSLKMHMMLHTNVRPFVCHLCGRGFISNNALKNHEGTHVEGKNFECSICHKKYKTEQLLRAHCRRHTTDGSRFMCDLCGNTFMYRSNLEAHMAVHGEERKYTCSVCDKCFKTAATLYSHKLVHKEDSPFTCDVCSKGFKSKERLAQHHRRHSGLKPFVCESCGHAFPDKGGLTKHRKTVHAIVKKFSCPECGKSCTRADNLRVHMKTHNDPSLLVLPLENLLTTGLHESVPPISIIIQPKTESIVPETSVSKTPRIIHFQTDDTNMKSKPDEETAANLKNLVDSVFDTSQLQVMQAHSAEPNNLNTIQEQAERCESQTLKIPASGYQIVATTGGTDTLIPVVQTENDQSKYANMETISASAMMLMTANFFQPLGNSQQ